MRLPRAVAVSVALVVAMTIASCGGQGETEEEAVKAAIAELQEDLKAGRYGEACEAMTDRPRRQIGSVGHGRQPTTCKRDLSEFVLTTEQSGPVFGEGLRQAPRPGVRDLTIDPTGRKAVVSLAVGQHPFPVTMAKVDGAWKLDDFFGATAPPPKALQ